MRGLFQRRASMIPARSSPLANKSWFKPTRVEWALTPLSRRAISSFVRSASAPRSNARWMIARQIAPIDPGCSAAGPTSYSTLAGTAGFGSVLLRSHFSRLEMLSIRRPFSAGRAL